VPRDELERLKATEEEERQQLREFLAAWRKNER
jgi:hypothetical protein